MNPFDFYFDYRSPYSYLAFTQFDKLARVPRFVPFDLQDVMKRVGNVPTSVVCAPKNRYVRADLKRWASWYGVPFERHPRALEIDGRRLLRATLAASTVNGERGLALAAGAIYRARWSVAVPLDTPSDIAAALTAAGLDGRSIEPLIDDPSSERLLDANSDQAERTGVFGAPTFVLGSDLYFGNDRLEFLRRQLEETA